ncbi:MAG: uroporphyrinogen-III decarboxylase-like protein, partial [Candidatus Aminicenantes bacterium RBG_13_63_10]
MMTPRERWLAVLARSRPDRAPMDYWATPEADRMLMRHLGCSTRRRALEMLRVDFVVTVRPEYTGPSLPPEEDVFGCRYREVDYGAGCYRECVHHPLAGFRTVEDVAQGYSWPVADWWDCRQLARQLEGLEDYPVQGGGSEPFLTYRNLRGEARAFMDLVENPEMAAFCLGRLVDLDYTLTERILEALPGRVSLTYVAEDMGGQTGLLISPEHIRRFLLPGMKRMIALSHQAGAFVFHHNDGDCRAVLPELVEAGIDILNPVQWRIPGMDRAGLKKDFGARLVFHGAMD